MSGLHDELIRAAIEGDMDMETVSNMLRATQDLMLGDEIPATVRLAIGNPPSGMTLPPHLAVDASADVMLESSEARIIRMLDRINGQTASLHVPGRPATSNEPAPRNDTYDVLTHTMQDATVPQHLQGRRLGRRVLYDVGISRRWPRANIRPAYRPRREIPLSSRDACRCSHFDYEHAPHRILDNNREDLMRMYREDGENRIRRQVFAHSGFGTTSNRQLVEMRQARALAGLNTSEYDVEIARRVLTDPQGWGTVGEAMRRRGWVDEVVTDGENYVLH